MKYIWEEKDIKPGLRVTQVLDVRSQIQQRVMVVKMEDASVGGRRLALMNEIDHTIIATYHATELAKIFTDFNCSPTPA
jgi:hypothetical protein